MNNKDFDKINMLYESTINEGVLSRAKANIAGGFGAVKGAWAGAKGDIEGVKKAATAKLDSYRKTTDKKIGKVYNDIVDDLIKLKLVDQARMQPAIDEFRQNLANSFNEFINVITLTATGAENNAPAAQQPAPAAQQPAPAAQQPAPAAQSSAPATPSNNYYNQLPAAYSKK